MSLEGQKTEESGASFDVSEKLESVEAAEKQLRLVKNYLVIYDEYSKLQKEWSALDRERIGFDNENVGMPGAEESLQKYTERLAGIQEAADAKRREYAPIFDQLTDETKDTYLVDENARDFLANDGKRP